jgi:hypothetical protein
MKGRDKYLMRRKAKQVGFFTEFGFQLRMFMLQAFKENA